MDGERGWANWNEVARTRDQAIISLRRLRKQDPTAYEAIRADYRVLCARVGTVGHRMAHRRMVDHGYAHGIAVNALYGALNDVDRLGEEEGLKTQRERESVKRILGTS